MVTGEETASALHRHIFSEYTRRDEIVQKLALLRTLLRQHRRSRSSLDQDYSVMVNPFWQKSSITRDGVLSPLSSFVFHLSFSPFLSSLLFLSHLSFSIF